MKTKSASNWSAAQSEDLYGFKRWGANHFSVDSDGFVQVQPLADGRNVRVMDVVDEAVGMGLKAPLVIRFQDKLRHRVVQLNSVFAKAIKEEGYKGEYRGVFPIKVNQLREVVDEIVAAAQAACSTPLNHTRGWPSIRTRNGGSRRTSSSVGASSPRGRPGISWSMPGSGSATPTIR